jgi:hypothetical protein
MKHINRLYNQTSDYRNSEIDIYENKFQHF